MKGGYHMAVKTELYDRVWMAKARARAGLTQAAIAKMIGIAAGHYNRIEQGIQTPNVKIGIAIATEINFQFSSARPCGKM